MEIYSFDFNSKTSTPFKESFRNESIKFEKKNMIPYGNPILNENRFIQLFIKNESKLNDKYLEMLIKELSLHPDYGHLVKDVGERFREEYQGSNMNVNETKYGGKKWSMKYKKKINCRKPKGFSQKQYCKYGRNKTIKNIK